MGSLAGFLQRRFCECCPSGWRCRSEVHVLDPAFRELLGYSPRADVLLEREDGTRRLWIEFEVSRADPVANHAKFATSHLFQPQADTDVFVAMVSSHVARGRRNLAANTILLMRHIGMNAFQTLLLPRCEPKAIKRLNHLTAHQLGAESLDAEGELQRALLISEPLAMIGEHRIHFVGDLLEVICNLQRWNHEMTTAHGQSLWKKRTVLYFVFDPKTRLFAPSKFCAFLDASHGSREKIDRDKLIMTMTLYVNLNESDPRFDGNRAQTHLCNNLGLNVVEPNDLSAIGDHFANWLKQNSAFVTVHPRGPRFLVPPDWFK